MTRKPVSAWPCRMIQDAISSFSPAEDIVALRENGSMRVSAVTERQVRIG